jgi:hypothetical protein
MKKLILLALAPLAVLAVPASAQRVEQRTVVHPNGEVTRTVVRGDGYGDRTVVRTERRVGDREVVRTERRVVDRDDRGDWRDGRSDRRHYGWRRGRAVQRCWTTYRHHRAVRVCNVRRGVRY